MAFAMPRLVEHVPEIGRPGKKIRAYRKAHLLEQRRKLAEMRKKKKKNKKTDRA